MPRATANGVQLYYEVHGEGEPIFLGVLENFPSRTWDGVPSISYLRGD